MKPGTLCVQGYRASLMSDTGSSADRLSRLAAGHRQQAARHAAFTAWRRCCTLAPKEGWGLGCVAMRQRAVTLRTQAHSTALAISSDTAPARREPPWGADGPAPARAVGAKQPRASAGVGGGQHDRLRASA